MYVLSLLPAPISSGPVHVDWHFQPSAQLGGDAFGYYWLDPGTFIFYLMDVSGHGVGPAMHSVTVMNVSGSARCRASTSPSRRTCLRV